MKIFACVIAACAANKTQWLMDTWWAEATKVYSHATNNYDAFKSVVDAAPNALFEPSFEFCGGANDAISSADLVTCAGKIADFGGVSDGSQNFIYDMGSKYYGLVDPQNTGVISFGKYKMLLGALAATNARVAMIACDEDKNGVLAGDEINKWYALAMEEAQSWNYSVSDGQWAALKNAYHEANANGDNVATMYELATLEILAGNVFLN